MFITALLDPAAEWKAEFVSAESPETCRKSSAGTMVRAAFTVKPGLRAAYACTTALGLYNVYLNGQKVSTDEMTPGWTSYNRRLLYRRRISCRFRGIPRSQTRLSTRLPGPAGR